MVAEDTRTSGNLLKHYEISRPMVAFHKFNEHAATSRLVARMVSGETMALVTDAGTPGISDPGFLLVRAAVEAGIEVVTLPGATAMIPAVVSSGLPCDKFVYEGFFPQKKGRQKLLASLAEEPRTMVFYESPNRLAKTLAMFAEVFGCERKAAVCREISKLHEQIHRGTLGQLAADFVQNPPRGEIVLVVGGKNCTADCLPDSETTTDSDDDDVMNMMTTVINQM